MNELSQPVLECEVCGEVAVEHRYDEPSGVGVWCCRSCGDLKRWCPRCDQGWIRRFQLAAANTEFLACDECDATWPSVDTIVPPGTDRQSFLRSLGTTATWAELTVRREQELRPPAV